jgi:flagellar biosynthetic protein FliR
VEDLLGLDALIRFGGLHVVRVLAAFWMLPVFSAGPGSRTMRLGFGLILGLTVAVARSDKPYEDPGSDPLLLTILVMKEMVFGLLLGWLAGIMFEAVKFAGSIISIEMGMHMANQIDPNTNTQLPVIGFLFQNIAIVLFFVSGGHQIVLNAFMKTFDLYPPGALPETGVLLATLLSFASLVISAGLKIAAPVFLLLVVVTVCVGFLAKMAPTLHILEASFPIRILVGFTLLVMFLPAMMAGFDDVMHEVGRGLLDLAEGGR